MLSFSGVKKKIGFWGELTFAIPTLILSSAFVIWPEPLPTLAQPADGRAITVRSDIQEANQITGVITARGNVRIDYPTRQIQATAAQAQYFTQDNRIVLTGNVYVLQEGNSVRGEVITYLIDEGRVVATPQPNRQVESIYYISDPQARATPATSPSTPYNPKPALKRPYNNPPEATPTPPEESPLDENFGGPPRLNPLDLNRPNLPNPNPPNLNLPNPNPPNLNRPNLNPPDVLTPKGMG